MDRAGLRTALESERLLLVATGRPAGLAALEGPGVEDAAARF